MLGKPRNHRRSINLKVCLHYFISNILTDTLIGHYCLVNPNKTSFHKFHTKPKVWLLPHSIYFFNTVLATRTSFDANNLR
jgi:hypothetical protein